MKKFFFLSIALVAGFIACNKPSEMMLDSKPVKLSVEVVGSAATRATGVTSNDVNTEAKVNSLQVLVFNNGSLDGYNSSTTTSVTVNCTSGSRKIYAVVNAASLAAVTSETDLLASVASLSDNLTTFQMIGSVTETLAQDSAVNIPVDRFAARVVLKGVRNSHANDALAADFKIVSAYLTNVTGDVDFGRSSGYTVSNWYNRRGYEASNNLGNGMTYDAINQTIAAGASYSTAHYFYSMPNAYDPAVGGVWSPRRARLVVQCEIAGTLYDYPIELPALESNKSYEINMLSITKNGNQDDGNHDPNDPDDIDEEKPIVGAVQAFEITVNDWSIVLLGEGGNVTI